MEYIFDLLYKKVFEICGSYLTCGVCATSVVQISYNYFLTGFLMNGLNDRERKIKKVTKIFGARKLKVREN